VIRKVEIENYRSCLDTSFELHPNLSVLIGPNSSGKTNILNALLLLRQLTEEYPYAHRADEEATRQCKLKIGFDVGGKKITLSVLANIFTDESNKDVVFSSSEQWYAPEFTGNRKRARLPLWLARELTGEEGGERFFRFARRRMYRNKIKELVYVPIPLRMPIAQVADGLCEMRYYSASQFTNPAKCPVSFEIESEGMRSRGIGLRGHAKFLFDIYNSSITQAETSYAQFFETIGPKGIGLVDSIEFKRIPTSSIEYSVRSGGGIKQRKREKVLVVPQFRIGKNNLSPNQLSEGTFKTITLLFYLVTETSKVLLLEEPEVCVHHGLLSSIIELVKTYSREKQIVVTTHSDFVLDHVQPENVYRVTNIPERGTKVSHITKSMPPRELAALREYLETEGNLGEYWRHGGLG